MALRFINRCEQLIDWRPLDYSKQWWIWWRFAAGRLIKSKHSHAAIYSYDCNEKGHSGRTVCVEFDLPLLWLLFSDDENKTKTNTQKKARNKTKFNYTQHTYVNAPRMRRISAYAYTVQCIAMQPFTHIQIRTAKKKNDKCVHTQRQTTETGQTVLILCVAMTNQNKTPTHSPTHTRTHTHAQSEAINANGEYKHSKIHYTIASWRKQRKRDRE